MAEEQLPDEELPMDTSRDVFYFTDGALAYAGHHYHDELNPVHSHSFVEIAFVIAGSATHLSLGGRQRLTAGDAVLLRPGVWHGYDDCDRLHLVNCCFSGELLRRELAWTRQDLLLEDRLAYRWTLTELADQLHLAPGYLVRLFKATTGLPPMAYLARLRAEHAATLLLHSDQPVTGIGRAVGWPDQNYFARRFKAHYGLSATTYRARFATGAMHLAPVPAGWTSRAAEAGEGQEEAS